MTEVLDVEFELIMPAYAAAADKTRTDGLRPPTLKGLLRFWWRAMHAHLPPRTLHKREGLLFGSADEEVGQGIRIIPRQSGPTGDVTDAGEEVRAMWHWYMGYGAVQWNRHSRRQETTVPRLKPGQCFGFRIVLPPRATEPDARGLCGALWLLSTFGGFGMRSRRGFGSLQLTTPLGGLPDLCQCATQQEAVEQIAVGLKALFAQPHTGEPEWTAFTGSTRVLVGPPRSNPLVALAWAAERFKRLRRNLGAQWQHTRRKRPVGRDFKLMHDYYRGQFSRHEMTKGAALGLPHNYTFHGRSGDGKPERHPLNLEVFTPEDVRQGKDKGSARRASPLMFSVLRIGGSEPRFVPVVLWIPVQFLGPGYEVRVTRKAAPRSVPVAVQPDPGVRDSAAHLLLDGAGQSMSMELGDRSGTRAFDGLQARGWIRVPWP